MTQHDDRVRLLHMLDHAREALELVQDKTRNDLDVDRVLSLALVRLLEIVGEAANRVSDDIRTQHPQLAWRQIVSLRNRLMHGYDAVDMDILWQILQHDVPSLISALENILSSQTQE